MEALFHINDWLGPLMALGALLTGAAILVGESLYQKWLRARGL